MILTAKIESNWGIFGEVFNLACQSDPRFRAFFYTRRDIFEVRCIWQQQIYFEIRGSVSRNVENLLTKAESEQDVTGKTPKKVVLGTQNDPHFAQRQQGMSGRSLGMLSDSQFGAQTCERFFPFWLVPSAEEKVAISPILPMFYDLLATPRLCLQLSRLSPIEHYWKTLQSIPSARCV